MTLEGPAKGSLGYELYNTEYGDPISKNEKREEKYTMIRHGVINTSMIGAVAATYYGLYILPDAPMLADKGGFVFFMGTLLAPFSAVMTGLIANLTSTAACQGLEKIVSLFDKKKEEKK